MKQVLIIGGLSTERDQTRYGQFFSEFISEYKFDMANFDELSFTIAPDNFSIKATKLAREVKDYDLVIFRGKLLNHRDLAYVICVYLKHHQTPFFNDYSLYRSSNKLTQAAFFFEQKVPFAPTYFALSGEGLSSSIRDNLSLPVVLKDAWGSHGDNNFLIKSQEELNQILADHADLRFIAQPFITNDSDYRILVMADREPLVIKRSANGDSHLNNTSQGGSAELIRDLPEEVVGLAKKLAKNSGMTLAGVDILPDKQSGEYFVLEINSQPQILTGAFIEEKHEAIKRLLDDYLN